MKKTFPIALTLGFAAAGAAFFLGESRGREITSSYKCPEEYTSFDEYARDTAASLAAFKAIYPDFTDDEILEKRRGLFISRGCEGHEFFAKPPTHSGGAE